MNEQEFAELAAGYALNALSPADHRAFEAAVAAHPEWSDIAQGDAETAAALAYTVQAVAPPLTLRSSLLSQIASLPQNSDSDVAPPDVDSTPEPAQAPPVEADVAAPADTAMIQTASRRNWTRGMLGLAASLVLLVVIGFGAVTLGQWVNRPAAVIALEQIEAAPDAQSATGDVADGGTATAHWSESLGRAVLVSDGLPSLTSGETFELWFVRDDGTPVSAGTFNAAGASTTTELAGAMQPGDTIAVTVEPSGGSKTGAPSTDPIVAIPTA